MSTELDDLQEKLNTLYEEQQKQLDTVENIDKNLEKLMSVVEEINRIVEGLK